MGSDLTEAMSESLIEENTAVADENTLNGDIVAQERSGLFTKIIFKI